MPRRPGFSTPPDRGAYQPDFRLIPQNRKQISFTRGDLIWVPPPGRRWPHWHGIPSLGKGWTDGRNRNPLHRSWTVDRIARPAAQADRSVRWPSSWTSASPPITDMQRSVPHVRFVPIAEVALIRSPRQHARGTLAGTVTRAALLAAILLHIAQRPQHVDKGQARL